VLVHHDAVVRGRGGRVQGAVRHETPHDGVAPGALRVTTLPGRRKVGRSGFLPTRRRAIPGAPSVRGK
jgi:hypothetical protein